LISSKLRQLLAFLNHEKPTYGSREFEKDNGPSTQLAMTLQLTGIWRWNFACSHHL